MKTSAQRQADMRARREAAGLVRYETWLTAAEKELVVAYIKELRAV